MGARRLALACLCSAALAAGLPPRSPADEPPDPPTDALRRRLEALESREAEEAARRREWQERERDQLREVEGARERLDEIGANRVRAQDGAYQGIRRSEWTRRWQQAQAELASAERALEELHEEARREDVPPGWLDEIAEREAAVDE